jgi:type II secretory ATPase GspE/PulE/Tfp pilus assembly ATPase PilB-like protein
MRHLYFAAGRALVCWAAMIKHNRIFGAAFVLAAAGALVRHAPSLAGALGVGAGFGSFPVPAWPFLLAAAILLIVSLVPFGGGRAPVAEAGRRDFRPESLAAVAARVAAFAKVEKPDVPLIVDYTVFQAIAAGASDIHFDPKRDGIGLRYRIQGMMTDVCTIPRPLAHPIVNRLKVIANLVIYRDALPQDGRFGADSKYPGSVHRELLRSGLASADFRIAFMPTLHGERIVIRILSGGDGLLDLAELGMDEHDLRIMNRLLAQPQGMVILTGPTGSGKTTTIYAALRAIQSQRKSVRSIATLEDPIEVDMEGINQSQVDEERNFTFDKGLRAVLRQDPDVILVGEVRDTETARIAIQAGMTGHLLITTVHAGSSAAAFSRLLEMGVAPYSLNAAVTAVIAQRLVRQICPHCRAERGLTEHDLRDLGVAVPPPGLRAFRGAGCEACRGEGYLGRTAIFEILEVTEEIRKVVSDGASVDAIHASAREAGMRTLYEAAIQAIGLGVTTPEEIARTVVRE